MRILVLGAGGIGGYFGGRLVEAGGDVTFLVRERRARQLRETGLVIQSPLGDLTTPVTVTTRDAVRPVFDLALLSCKAYDLESAIEAVQAALTPEGRVLPLLNGLAHLDRLDATFGRDRVCGGLCHISATLGPAGEIQHLNRLHRITFGERSGGSWPDLAVLEGLFHRAAVDARHSPEIMLRMWEKFVLLTTLAAMTCLMRAPVGAILATRDGRATLLDVLDVGRRVATAAGYPPSIEDQALAVELLTQPDSTLKASMLRDIERGGPTEADPIVGHMLRSAEAIGIDCPALRLAYGHLQAYEAQRTGR
jgi:2-dehydropantoate 2-reductase